MKEEMLKKECITPTDVAKVAEVIKAAKKAPIQGLPVYEGHQCPHCEYIARAPETVQRHRRNAHQDREGPRATGRRPRWQADPPPNRGVSCQRLFPNFRGCQFFEVQVPEPSPSLCPNLHAILPKPSPAPHVTRLSAGEPVSETVAETAAEFALAYVRQALRVDPNEGGGVQRTRHRTEVSPWLELTRWPEYLSHHPLDAVAALGAKPEPDREPLLVAFAESVRRLMEAGRQAITEHQINHFDQIRINTFSSDAPGRRSRPIHVDLKRDTYRRYCGIWQRLVCFAYRSTRADQAIRLGHRLTAAQEGTLTSMEEHGQDLTRLRQVGGSDADIQKATGSLDDACLEFSIQLLDHTLTGDLHESVLVGFLAILGIHTNRQTFREPSDYTTYLSGLVKMAQLLVAKRAVRLVELGQAARATHALRDMRGRFMMFGSSTPFDWVLRLLTYGKKIRIAATRPGHIDWSDDRQTVSYKDQPLGMGELIKFVGTQVALAKAALRELLLLKGGEMAPCLALETLRDDPSETRAGWNFLQHPRNHAVLSAALSAVSAPPPAPGDTPGQQWLLERVLVRDGFLEVRTVDQKPQAIPHAEKIKQYLARVEAFLRRLLLLVHITGGQPARATELLSLRHSNTSGGLRGIFLERGLVGTVTTYHKGYATTKTTKVIHRYLPAAVSKLVVYYLWLVLPFRVALEGLVSDGTPASPFLWPTRNDARAPDRLLRQVLQAESQVYLPEIKLDISTYRHVSIAIAREKVARGSVGGDPVMDLQAGHVSSVADGVYGRLVGEARGHLATRRQQYRDASRRWQDFLRQGMEMGPETETRTETESETRKRPCVPVWDGDDTGSEMGLSKRCRTH
jgi:hypothetical protein